MIDVFAYYDGPKLVVGSNEVDHLFLAVMAEHLPSAEVWLLEPLSLKRYGQLCEGGIDFRPAFLKSETTYVYRVQIPHAAAGASVQLITAETLPDEMLPIAGEYPEHGLGTFGRTVAHQLNLGSRDDSQSPLLDLHFKTPRPGETILSARIFTSLVNATQTVLKAVAREQQRREISPQDFAPTLEVAAVYRGSAGVVFTTNDQNERMESILESFVDTVTELHTRDSIWALGLLGPNTVGPLRKYANLLARASGDVSRHQHWEGGIQLPVFPRHLPHRVEHCEWRH